MTEQASGLEHAADEQALGSSFLEVRPHAGEVAVSEPFVPGIVGRSREAHTNVCEVDERMGNTRFSKEPSRFACDSRFPDANWAGEQEERDGRARSVSHTGS